MEISGKIIAVCPEQKGTSKKGNEWKQQTFALETNEQYPKKVAFDLFGSKLEEFGKLCTMDAQVTVSFDIESREYNGRWYTSVRAWKVETGEKQDKQVASAPPTSDSGLVPPPETPFEEGPIANDLPF